MKNERIDIPAELFEDEVVCFIADRYHTSAENVVRCFLVQDGIYPNLVRALPKREMEE